MQLNRKPVGLILSLVSAVGLLGAGCSGINSSQGVSPASFLLPGFFGQTKPAPPTSRPTPDETVAGARPNSGQTLALAN